MREKRNLTPEKKFQREILEQEYYLFEVDVRLFFHQENSTLKAVF